MAVDKKIVKENWISNFTLIGVPQINDYTFKIDERSEKSNWVYNSLNIGINCGEKHGTVYAEMMGGYSDERENFIYVHGKKDDGNDDFDNRYTIDWEDRFNEEILEEIGDLCFLTVGLEKTDKGKTYYKKFLSAYDAIAYIQEHITSDMVVNVRGRLQYSMWNEKVQVRKTIDSIVLSSVDDASKYRANFTQSILMDKDSASLKNIDKNKSVMYVDARVLDYLKEHNGVEVKGQFPYNMQFEFEMPFDNEAQCKKIMDKIFKVKKDITQITFEGDFIEGGATVMATWDDVTDDIKELVECGVYTEEDAIARCSSNGNREKRMVLRKPYIKLVGEDKTPEIQRFDQQYTEDDLVLDCMMNDDDTPWEEDDDSDANVTKSADAGDDMGWLDSL